ncbi:hypothetical protein BE17_44770 [Sorangium cellulosum]|uniref:HEPN domain-containing protein n=1 Tax=Sorangium cellulosum TaxID=56 RepID=A0A150RAI2_SORCE|nr:hypothetical protein BE17_44770 [Sorangium cellulosum]
MADEATHLSQAAHNAAFLEAIDKERYPDWAVTVVFYVALHYVDAFLARKGRHEPATHENRERLAKTFTELRRVVPQYLRLKSASVRARYHGEKPSAEDVQRLIDSPLAELRSRIEALLQQP